MKVKDIQIDGFGVWTGLSVDSLPQGMTLFYGPNEAGKTTLMQFIRAMLYGFTDDRREKYLPPLYGGTPGGAIRVAGPGGGYEVRRHCQLTDTTASGQLTVTGQDGLSQGQHRLDTLLGQIDEPIFTNVFAIGMRELQELSTLDDTAAADELYKLSSGLDRVSLVDVLRSLRSGRESMIGSSNPADTAEAQKLVGLIRQREKLRDEVQQLTGSGRRWSELASQRRSQQQEIDQLSERIATWEQESRCVEIAIGIFETWQKRNELAEQVATLESETLLPDEAPGQLVQIEANVEEHRARVEEIKERRREIRQKAEQLPVSRQMLDLRGRIEAAAEQATWVEALEEQIERLGTHIDNAREQLKADAERVGMEPEDAAALADGDTSAMPDLSRETLSALVGPAKRVKQHAFVVKQARRESTEHRSRAEKMGESLRETLDRARSSDLQQAIRQQTEAITKLRHRLQVGEHLKKLQQHYRDLESETVDLVTAEALPVDRVVLLALPFIGGGMFLIYGLAHVFGITWLVERQDPTWGMILILLGAMSLLTFYFGRENGQRSNRLDREDCERQIDTLRKQIRDVEVELKKIDSTLPASSQSIEQQVRVAEQLLEELESSLPTYHGREAALQAYRSSRDRANDAVVALKEARRQWSSTLDRLGLSESLSPSSVRQLSDGYETLQASRRRLDELQAEKEQRRRERKTIAKRIEALYFEALAVNEDQARSNDDDEDELEEETVTTPVRSHTGPLDQLNYLNEELARHQHWIKRRRDLKQQDSHLKRQQVAHHRAIERGEQHRRSLWAKCGVATPEQFYKMVDDKGLLSNLTETHQELDKQIRSMIGTHVEYDDVAHELDGVDATDLEKRWDLLASRISETESRVAQLRTQQGELAQEMKHLGDDKRLTVVRLELGCVERRITSVCQRWQTLAMASCLMEDVCGTFERERQPETLREASTFLSQLTDGKYTRIWTPLGTNQLKIDDADEASLPLEVLSRGTREAVFIALRLSLAAAYARRGAMLPLVLDDVLVNFDRQRAMHAARTLKTFAELGHQVLMFTCHEHIVEIFQEIEVEVRLMPPQGEPGRATVLEPPELEEDEYEVEPEELEEEELAVEEVVELTEPEEEEVVAAEVTFDPPEPEQPVEPEPVVVSVPRPAKKKRRRPKPLPPVEATIHEPAIDWAWFEREPIERLEEVEDAVASISRDHWIDDEANRPQSDAPEEVWNRNNAWWSSQPTS